MIATLFASTIFAGTGCHVPVQRIVAHQANYGYQAAAVVDYGHAQNYSPYYSASALAYRVEDPERAALVRANEKLIDANKAAQDALAGELKAARERADRQPTSEGTTPTEGQGGPASIPHLASKARDGAAILKATCLKCHAEGKSAAKDYTMSFLEGGKLSSANSALVNMALEDGKMPPGNPLAQEDKEAILAFIADDPSDLKKIAAEEANRSKK